MLPGCSDDGGAVVNCDGTQAACKDSEMCSSGKCIDACADARAKNSSIGCEYYAVRMDSSSFADGCFVAFVANTSRGVTHVHADLGGVPILGDVDDLEAVLAAEAIDTVVMSVRRNRLQVFARLSACKAPYSSLPSYFSACLRKRRGCT